ncbi:MAG: AAA family ATPase [Pelosinus sp.]|nr:AAA family ATPase [Pelosinus sp.]
MEDHRSELILILAGYQAEMEVFLQTNPGLRSRFPIHIDFPDYTQTELLRIAELFCQGRQYQLSSEAKLGLLKILNSPQYLKSEVFGNARVIRNLIEKGIRRQAVRLITKPHISRDELMLLQASDLAEGKE